MISQIAHNSQTSMVEVKTGLSLYTAELGNPDGAPMLILHGEPPLVCRRLITSSHATISNVSNCA